MSQNGYQEMIYIEQTGLVSYKVQLRDNIWRHHVDQLLDLKSSTLLTESDVTITESDKVTFVAPDHLTDRTPLVIILLLKVIKPTYQSHYQA